MYWMRRAARTVISTTEAENKGAEGPLVFESTPQKSSAAVTAADRVLIEQSDFSVFARFASSGETTENSRFTTSYWASFFERQ